MVPSYDCAASVLLCAEDNTAILGLDGEEEEEECSWAAATPPRDAAAAAAATDGFLMDFPALSDECIAALVEREEEHMPMEGYPERLQPRPESVDLAAVRRDALDWIWKVIEHYNFAPLTAVLSVNYLDRYLSENGLPEREAWMTQLLAVACLSLAAKMEETFVPLPLDLQVAEAQFVFEARTIERMELLVLRTLKWRMRAVTACSFIDYFLNKFSDHGAPSLPALSRSTDLILSTAKGVEFVAFRPSEIAASVALTALGECRSSVLERSITSCKYISKEEVLRCYEMSFYDLGGSAKVL
ncbi:cyclin-D3-1-like isoform X2 [Oryza brachyantha]|uniref:cyclin-D3-1-like isoform X2 n=1 Tax=Oryza brachyantha TaxID=4533 RepID=UPI00077666C4|nr:cyclin-D3-1-like isoform X2 [Oryza brachyantha]